MNPQAPESPCADSSDAVDDCRCLCGSLLARHVAGGVELKCRRCKRTLLVPFDPSAPEGARVHSVELIPARRAG